MDTRIARVESWQHTHEEICQIRHRSIEKMFDSINAKLTMATLSLIGALFSVTAFLLGKALAWW